MQISVVIPTCNRKARLLSLLQHLDRSAYPFEEVIIVDSGEELLRADDYGRFTNLIVHYLQSEKSVCIQRNIGIQKAVSPWIFLCDDDIEVPADYIRQLVNHIHVYKEAGAVTGMVLQKEKDEWVGTYPVTSAKTLLWNYIFQLSVWGEINCSNNNFIVKRIKQYYAQKGNHISKAGWPVLVNFSGEVVTSPVYGLGASLVKKEWLLQSPYDEVLDRHGIGDNYGVAVGFPIMGIHIVTNAFVYHHQEPINRLKRSLQFYRRTLALHYFIKTKPAVSTIKTRRLVWSLTGSGIGFMLRGDGVMLKAVLKSIRKIITSNNPYIKAFKANKKITEPT